MNCNNNNFFSRSQLDKYALDDDTKFWVELYEIPEMNPIREYKGIIIEDPYEHTVSLDLDTRVSSIFELFESKKSNKLYIIKLANRLLENCINNGRLDLAEVLGIEIQKRKEKL